MDRVTEATVADADSWRKYVERSPQANLAHCWQWREILAETFRHEPIYLVARNETSEVSGVLPLFLVRSFLFGSALISMPYLNGGGVVSSSESARNELIAAALKIARERKVKYLELRHRAEFVDGPRSFVVRSHKVAMVLELRGDAKQVFDSFPKKLRSQVRRPAKEGVSAQALGTVEDFYAVFSENMRDLGTPVYPRELFERTHGAFGQAARIVTAHYQGAPVAAGFTIGFRDTVEIPWASSLRRLNRLSPNMALYWEAIRLACEGGYRHFDFGRSSPESGTYRFKAQWGAKPLPLFWYYGKDGHVPDINPKSTKFSLLVACWRRLPLTLANSIGPIVSRSLP